MPKKEERIPYHPRKGAMISDDTIAGFIRAPINGDLAQVPGIAESTIMALAQGDEPIKTSHQLFGKFLALSPDEPDRVEHCNRFKYWLQDKNVGIGSLNIIVEAIAQKTETWIPGAYSADALAEEV